MSSSPDTSELEPNWNGHTWQFCRIERYSTGFRLLFKKQEHYAMVLSILLSADMAMPVKYGTNKFSDRGLYQQYIYTTSDDDGDRITSYTLSQLVALLQELDSVSDLLVSQSNSLKQSFVDKLTFETAIESEVVAGNETSHDQTIDAKGEGNPSSEGKTQATRFKDLSDCDNKATTQPTEQSSAIGLLDRHLLDIGVQLDELTTSQIRNSKELGELRQAVRKIVDRLDASTIRQDTIISNLQHITTLQAETFESAFRNLSTDLKNLISKDHGDFSNAVLEMSSAASKIATDSKFELERARTLELEQRVADLTKDLERERTDQKDLFAEYEKLQQELEILGAEKSENIPTHVRVIQTGLFESTNSIAMYLKNLGPVRVTSKTMASLNDFQPYYNQLSHNSVLKLTRLIKSLDSILIASLSQPNAEEHYMSEVNGIKLAMRESESTMNNSEMVRQREVVVDGTTYVCQSHLKCPLGKGNPNFRAYFYWEQHSRQIILGPMGHHLDVSSGK